MYGNTEMRELRQKTRRYLNKNSVEDIPPEWRSSISTLLDELSTNHRELTKYRTYIEEAQDIIYEIDMRGEIVYMSPAIQSLMGYSHERMLEEDFRSYVHPEDNRLVEMTLEKIVTERRPEEVEVRIRHAEGGWRHHYARGTLLYDEEGNPRSVLVISRDVTEHRRMEEEIRRSEEQYRSYVENAPHGVFLADGSGRYFQVNPAAREITGYSEEELLSMRISDLIHPDGREEAARHFDELRTEGRVKVEEPFIHKSGEKRWWRVTAVKLSEERYLGYTEDITEKRASEQELLRAHRQFLTVLNGLDAGVFVVSQRDNTILYANRYVEEFFEEEIIGKRCYDYFSEEGGHSCAHCTDFSEEDAGSSFISMEYQIPGTGAWFLMQVRGIKWIDGILARLHILTDISAIKDRERLREDMNRITRHDLKSPLNGILGASQLLLDEELNDSHRRLVYLIEDSGKRMMTIINQSLSLYKMEEGTYTVQQDAVSCRQLITTIVDEIGNSSEGRGKELRVGEFKCGEENCEDIRIQGEYDLCYSILTNLLKNAVEASEDGDPVEVEVRERDGMWVELTVWNRTPVPEEIRRSFGSKYSTAGKKYGTGLGVYSVHLMTEVQGGRFGWSSSESEGTTVRVELPKYGGNKPDEK